MSRTDAPYSMGEVTPRTQVTLPPISALSGALPAWATRRSKSSGQSDESFSAYLHHPSSSSPALDRILDGNGARRFNVHRSGGDRRLPGNLDSISYAHERASPFGRGRVPLPPTPVTLRNVPSATPGWERDPPPIYRQSSMWRQQHPHQVYQPQHEAPSFTSFPMTTLRDSDQCDAYDDYSDEADLDDTQGSGGADQQDSQDSQETAAEKKKRRRTNKDEANVLAAVFEQTAFPGVSTREVLAERLGMNLRSVSIWFQNRRQAMKKRASRFGGVDGVRGTTVTATPLLHDGSTEQYEEDESRTMAQGRLKRWLSLDEVAARSMSNVLDVSLGSGSSQDSQASGHGEDKIRTEELQPSATNTKSCAPILELLRKRMGNRLTRVASMPSVAAALNGPSVQDAIAASESKKSEAAKDLRDFLKNITTQSRAANRPALSRSASMTALRSSQLSRAETKQACVVGDDSTSIGSVHATKADIGVPEPLDVASQAPMGRTAAEEKILREQQDIWQRMQSSSSGISSEATPESDKENNEKIRGKMMLDEEGFEDEEKTLRKVAQRRASRQLAKKEQKLSQEGSKYVLEADARLALHKATSGQEASSTDKAKATQRLPLAPLGGPHPRAALQRSRSDAIALGRSGLSRVASLDVEAGRDRSKAAERPSPLLMAERLALHSVKTHGVPHKKRTGHVRRATMGDGHVSSSATGGRRSLSGQAVRGAVHHSIGPTMSKPTMMRSSSGPLVHKSVARESDARHSERGTSSERSSNASDGSSLEWAEGLSGELAGHANATAASAPEWWRSLKRRSPAPVGARSAQDGLGKRTHSGGHDDSGFFGSDDADDDDENVAPRMAANEADPARKRQRISAKQAAMYSAAHHRLPLTSIQSRYPLGSPLKRGDDRDRLAAETLLAFGSHA